MMITVTKFDNIYKFMLVIDAVIEHDGIARCLMANGSIINITKDNNNFVAVIDDKKISGDLEYVANYISEYDEALEMGIVA